MFSWLKSTALWCGFYLLRWCERWLPIRVLRIFLWPFAAAWGLAQLRPRQLLTSWRRFPESLRPNPWRFFSRQSLGLYQARTIYLWPDRLSATPWISRCRLEGGRDLIGMGVNDRGVVLASLHFGPFELLPYWLRAHGIVTTMLRGPTPDFLRSLTSYQHALSPPGDVPVFMDLGQMTPLPRFTRVGQFLGPGRRLVVTVDVDRGLQFQVPFENRIFRMATGAIRLAQMADTELIPCLIAETAPWKFSLHIGTPVPQHYLGHSPDLQAIGVHLLTEFSKVITRHPEQCRPRLLSAISPLPKEASDLSAFARN